MSILIKGMAMPKNCDECSFYDGDTYGICDVVGLIMLREGKYSHCPLVELPPHGDLIGREWLIDIALHLMNTAKNDDIANGVKWLWQYVIEAPTIIESEVE